MALARRFLGYRSEEAVEKGVAMTREALTATVRLAQSRGAVPLIVVPQFEPEESQERELRQRIIEEAHLPYVYVPLDPDDRVENDGHPDVDGARTIAEAIADALRPAWPAVLEEARLRSFHELLPHSINNVNSLARASSRSCISSRYD
jgi:hypothetical protein